MTSKPFVTSPGVPLPFGASCTPDGVNFAIFSRHAELVTLVLFQSGRENPVAEIPLDPVINKTGDVWHILVHDLDIKLRYGYRISGPYDPQGLIPVWKA